MPMGKAPAVTGGPRQTCEVDEFQSLVEACPDCVLTIDNTSIIQYANPSVTRIFGYSISEIIGESVAFVLCDIEGYQDPIGEFTARHKSGKTLCVEATCGTLKAKRAVFIREISQGSSKTLRFGNDVETLRLILETLPALVYSRSPDGRVDYANHRATEYFGMTLEDICNGGWTDALHPDERESVLASIETNFSKREPYTMEYRRRRFDGEYRWFQTSVEPLKNSQGEVIKWYGLLTDVHDRRVAEEALRVTQMKLSDATQKAAMSEFAASVVHEISQPISAMVMNGHACLQWLAMRPPNLEDVRTAVERVVRDGSDAREIIESLRALFRRTPPRQSAVRFTRIIDEVIALTRNRFHMEHIRFDVCVDDHLSDVFVDHLQLQQVLMNLVLNALEAMHRILGVKTITIRARQEDGMLLTEVEDQGVGIGNADRIFDTFFTNKASGMGMGLSICRTIIEAHQGRLWCNAEKQDGAIFYFTVPLARREQL
jgi:PAS domain S-box-containing protein